MKEKSSIEEIKKWGKFVWILDIRKKYKDKNLILFKNEKISNKKERRR